MESYGNAWNLDGNAWMGLSTEQWKFIAARLTCNTDGEAAKLAGVHAKTPSNWKASNPEFAAALETAAQDGVHVAQEIMRQHLGEAAAELVTHLKANKTDDADYGTRQTAITTMFKTHGVLVDRRDITSGGKTLRILIDDGNGNA